MTKVVGPPSVVVGPRGTYSVGSGDRREGALVLEGECEGVFPLVGVARVEFEDARFLEINEVNRSMVLTAWKEMGVEEVKSDVADFPFDDLNFSTDSGIEIATNFFG